MCSQQDLTGVGFMSGEYNGGKGRERSKEDEGEYMA